jgi:HSP20 family molecular chaperone IbpA
MLMHFEQLRQKGELKLRLELPDGGPTAIEFSVEPSRLTIHSIETRAPEWVAGRDSLHLGDGTPAPIGLEIPLPVEVDPDATRAHVVDGVLDVTFKTLRRLARPDLDIPISARVAGRAPLAITVGAS